MQASAAARGQPVARIAPLVPVLGEAEPIASAAGIFHAVAQVTGMPSEAVPGDSTDPTRAATVIVAPPAWDLAVAASTVGVAALVEEVAASAVGVAALVEAVAADVAAVVAGKHCRIM